MSANINFHGVKKIEVSKPQLNTFGISEYNTRTITITFEDNSVSLIDLFASNGESLQITGVIC